MEYTPHLELYKVNMPSRKERARLITEWYQKLRKEGFNDIEWYNPKYGYGQNSDYLKHSAYKMRYQYKEATDEHYRLLTNFTTHYKFPRKRDKLILELYSDGMQYRQILEKLRTKGNGYGYSQGKRSISLLTLHRLLKRYIKIAYEWNASNPEGLHYVDANDIKPET